LCFRRPLSQGSGLLLDADSQGGNYSRRACGQLLGRCSIMNNILLEARALKKYFTLPRSLFKRGGPAMVRAVDDVSFHVREGETLGLVGESGCGKTTTARLLLRLYNVTDGKIVFDGTEVQHLVGRHLRDYRNNIQAVFQDPYSSLNPRMRVGDIVGEPLIAAGKQSRAEIRDRVAALFSVVGLNPDATRLFPHEFSGGQRQRIAIARSLALRPRLIILDEAVSALDVSIRAQILNLLQELQEQFKLSYVLISHDLDVVAHMCTEIAVMYLGKIVETGSTDAIRDSPLHPYTQALYSAALPARPKINRQRTRLTGELPSPIAPPSGCYFHTRCPIATQLCAQRQPALLPNSDGHAVACHLVDRGDRALASAQS
jgi:oligopeptide/dipeptide ABC transporter ATP-binding protein